MFTIHLKTFHDTIKPLIYSNCFAGLGPFRRPNQNETTYFLMKLYTVFIILIQWAAIYVTSIKIDQVINFENTSPMALAMYRGLVFANSCITVFAQFLIWLRRKAMRNFLKQIEVLDEIFQSVLGVRNEYKKDYIHLTNQLVAIFIVVCLISVFDTVISLGIEPQMNVRVLILFFSVAQTLHHPILVMLLLDMNFRIFVGYLEGKFRGINDSLSKLIEKPSTYYPAKRLLVISRKVRQLDRDNEAKEMEDSSAMSDKHQLFKEIRKAHLELCQLSRKINSAFGMQNLLSMGISFAMVTGLLYTIYSAFSWKNFKSSMLKQVIPTAIWTAIYIVKIWMVNHSCWVISNEAKRTGEVIYELLNSRVNVELQREIQEFGLQILQNPVHFNACGFFTLDYTFVQGAIGSITTYLVILIQMSNSPENSAPNETVTDNVPKVIKK